MFCNNLCSQSRIEIKISYDIEVVDYHEGTTQWFASDVHINFHVPLAYQLYKLNGVIVNRYYNGDYCMEQSAVEFATDVYNVGQDGYADITCHYPDKIGVRSISDYESRNQPQLAFMAGDSWQIDPMQYGS